MISSAGTRSSFEAQASVVNYLALAMPLYVGLISDMYIIFTSMLLTKIRFYKIVSHFFTHISWTPNHPHPHLFINPLNLVSNEIKSI